MKYIEQEEQKEFVKRAGKWAFEVIDATEAESNKKKLPMIKLKLKVDKNGTCFDNLVFTASSMWKIGACRACLGFSKGEVGNEIDIDPSDFIGRTGTAIFKLAPDGKNLEVQSYLKAETTTPQPAKKPTVQAVETDENDPF